MESKTKLWQICQSVVGLGDLVTNDPPIILTACGEFVLDFQNATHSDATNIECKQGHCGRES